MSKVVSSIFGGRPKPNKRAEALQRRQLQDANNERAELEAEKADVAGTASRTRSGRSLLTYIRKRGKMKMGA